MILIEVTSIHGQPPAHPLRVEFDEFGGTIGRGSNSTLVLADPDKSISRTHARIYVRSGINLLTDMGTATPVYLNGNPVGNGRETPIERGDEIRIGGYGLRVAAGTRSEAGPAPFSANSAQSKNDPAAAFNNDLQRSAARHSNAAGLIPEGFDFFATPSEQRGHQGVMPEDLDFDPAHRQDIDRMFGLDINPRGADTYALDHPLGAVWAAAPAPNVQQDQVPELRGAFTAPERSRDRRIGGEDMMLSPEAKSADIVTASIPSATRPQLEPELRNVAPAHPLATADEIPTTTPDSSGHSQLMEHDPLTRSFLEGAGMSRLPLGRDLTPELMRIVGQLLREAVQGALALLKSRALTKRELRADLTMIVECENNPLKFSPNVETALSHLLTPQADGFMAPTQAMRDAYEDLQVHQLATFAGMRAALDGVLMRFDPAQLEQRLTKRTVIDTVLPVHRRAKLWGLFEDLSKELKRQAEDDFDALFGREFRRAYEAELKNLRNKP